jgi:hypothetical protein
MMRTQTGKLPLVIPTSPFPVPSISLWLLVSQPLATFLWSRTVASLTLTGLAVVVSTWWFRRCVHATPAAAA